MDFIDFLMKFTFRIKVLIIFLIFTNSYLYSQYYSGSYDGYSSTTATLPTYSISGNIKYMNSTSLQGVIVSLSGSSSNSTTTDINGNYSFTGLQSSGTYTVTPSKPGYYFQAADLSNHLTYNNLNNNITNANFNSPDLIAYYPFNGNANDESGNGQNGVVSGTTTLAYDRFGNSGKAYNFYPNENSSDYNNRITISSFAPPSIVTISIWFNPKTQGPPTAPPWHNSVLFSNGEKYVNHDNISAWMESGQIIFRMWNTEGTTYQIVSNSSISLNIWHHVVCIIDDQKQMRMYLDDVLQSQTTNWAGNYSGCLTTNIGNNVSDDDSFDGTLDDIRVYNRAFSDAEVHSLYNSEAPITNSINGSISYMGMSHLPEVTVTLSYNSTNVTTTTASDGTYSFTGLTQGLNYTITPSKTGFAFNPVSLTYNNLNADVANANFNSPDLIASYSFNGNANDGSSNNLNGTVYGATLTTDRFGVDNKAYNFDGVNSYVLIGDPVPNPLQIQNEITISAWIFVSQYPTNDLGLIVGSQAENATGATLMLDGRTNPDGLTAPAGHIHFQIGGSGSWHMGNSNSQVPLNQWVHITATRKANGEPKIYYNGVCQPVNYDMIAWNGTINYTSWIAIGRQKDAGRNFNGKIDEVKIYNRELSEPEVLALYNSGAPTTNSINGTINYMGTSPLQGVTVTLNYNSNNTTTTTGADGTYSFIGLTQGVNYTVTPSKSGYAFNPVSLTYNNLSANVTNANFNSPDLIAYYPFNSNANDESGNGHNGTVINTTLANDRFGNTNKAYYFNGTNAYIDMGSWEMGGSTTISAWVKYEAWKSWPRIIEVGNSVWNNNIILTDQNLGLHFKIVRGVDDMPGPIVPNCLVLNTWILVTGTINSSGVMKLYKNGVLIGTDNNGIVPAIMTRTQQYIGKSLWPGDELFQGLIDDIRIYNRELSGNEILALYNSEAPLSISGTITIGSNPLSGVTVSDGTRSASTNESGVYTITDVPNGTYIITPTKSGYTFSPATLSVTVAGSNQADKNFSGNAVFARDQKLVTANVNGNNISFFQQNESGEFMFEKSIDLETYPIGVFIYNQEVFVTCPGDHSIRVYNYSDIGSVSPKRKILGGNTNLVIPVSLVVDNGKIYVSDCSAAGGVKVFDINADGNIAPEKNIGNLPFTQGIAVLGDSIYVSRHDQTPGQWSNSIYVYNKNATAASSPASVISRPCYDVAEFPNSLFVIGGEIFVADFKYGEYAPYTISVYNVDNHTLIRTLNIPANLLQSWGCLHSIWVTDNEIFVGLNNDADYSKILVFNKTDYGNASPMLIISGNLNYPWGISIIPGKVNITGTITSNGAPLPGVIVSDGTRWATTNESGIYTITGVPNGNYTLTPVKSGYTFSPASMQVTVNGNNLTGKNFNASATINTVTISGYVTGTNSVTMILSGSSSGSTTTTGNGYYSFTVSLSGNYTITPTLAGYTFNPVSQTFNNITSNQIQNFIGTHIGATISISKTNIDFGPNGILTGVKDTSIIITNNSSVDSITITSVSLTNADSVFQIIGTPPAKIPPLGSVSITIRFNTNTVGILTNTLHILNSSVNSPDLEISLSGVVYGSTISSSLANIDFGSVGYNLGQIDTTIRLQNTGKYNLKISSISFSWADSIFEILNPISSDGLIIPAGGLYDLKVRFKSISNGTRSNIINVVNNSTNNPNIQINITGKVISSTISVSPLKIDFGNMGYNDQAKDTIINMLNTGEQNLNITSAMLSTLDSCYEILTQIPSGGLIITPKTSYNLQLRFKPNQTGTISNSIAIQNNSTNLPVVKIDITGSVLNSTISVNTLSLDFGKLGYMSDTKDTSFKILNTGKYNLKITSVSLNTPDTLLEILTEIPPEGVIIKPDSNSYYEIKVRLKPNQKGSISNQINIVNNSSNTPTLQVKIQGTVIAPYLTIIPININFGTTTVDSFSITKAILVKNSGSAPITIKNKIFSGDTASFKVLTSLQSVTLPDGQTDSIKIMFYPKTAGIKSARIDIVSTDITDSQYVIMSGTGGGKPILYVSASKIDFGSTIVGKTKETVIMVKNNGNLTLNIINKTIAGTNKDDYTLTGNVTVLERGKSDSIRIKLTGNLPAGTKTAQLQISSNDPDKSLSAIDLTTIVRVPVLTKTIDKIIFDTIAVKDTSVKTFTIKNTGDTVLTVKAIFVDGPFPGDFIIPGITFPFDIPIGVEKTISVKFSPSDIGNRYGVLTITSNDPANQQVTIVVRGQGISNTRPIISLSTNQVDFNIVGVGKTAEATIKIKNTGTDNLIINNITITGDNNTAFSIQGITFPFQIATNEERTIPIKFTPPAGGIETASIVIKSNDPLKPEIIAGLRGEGKALLKPNISVSTAQMNLGENGMHATSTSTFKIENTGGEVLTVSNIVTGGNNPADFSISGVTFPQDIPVNGEYVVTVTFTPTNTGDRSAQLIITSNDPVKGDIIVNLIGKGKGSLISVNLSEINFGSVGHQSGHIDTTIQILNAGNFKLRISTACCYITDACFCIISEIPSEGIMLNPGEQYILHIKFNPIQIGIKQNSIMIANNSSNSGVISINLTGIVLQPNIRTQDTILITRDSINKIDTNKPSTTVPIIITNGTTVLQKVNIPQSIITIIDKYIAGDTISFHIKNKIVPITLGPGQSDTTEIEFRPRSAGLKTAILHIISNDVTPHRQINLSGEGNGKAIISTIDKIDFGDIKYGKTKDSVIYVRNKGNFDLNISSRNMIGTNKDNFEIRSTNIAKTLQTDEIDSITIRINSGTVYGTKSAQLQIMNNDPVSGDYRITLLGNTIMPVITRNIDKLVFDTVGIGYTMDTVFTIGNDGNDILTVNNINIDGAYASEFTIPEQTYPITINSKGQIKIKVRFSPTGTGNRYASLTINNNDPVNSVITITVSGNGKVIDIPKINVATKSIDFGTLEILSTKDTTITIKNEGTAKLQIDSLYVTGNDKVSYQLSGMTLPLQLDPSTTKDIKITYLPKASNASSTATIRIVGNDPFNSVTEILLSGKSVSNPNIVVSIEQINFGVLGITGQKDTAITIKNTGTAKLNIDSLNITGTEQDYYKVINPTIPFSIEPGGSQNITIRFTPKVGSYLPSAKLIIVSNSTKSSIIEIQLSGSISRPVIYVENTKIDYGRVMILNPKDMTITIMNKGNQELSIDTIKIGGNNPKEFTLIKDNPVIPFKLGSNEVKTFPIRFIADTIGIKTAIVEISSNDPLLTKTNIEITGSVLAPKIAMDIQGISFSNVTVNTNRDTLIKIRNTGDTNLVIQGIRITDGDTTDYNILDNINGKIILPNTVTNFRVRFTPSQTGVRSVNVEIRTNDVSNASIRIALTGTGIQSKITVLNTQISMGRLFIIKSKDTGSTITNAGTDVLYLKRISITGTDSARYKITNTSVQLPANIKPNESVTYTIQFSPGEKGIKEAQISIESNDPTSGIYKIPLSGEGIIPKIVIDNEMTGDLNQEKQVNFHLTESYMPDIIRVYYRKGGDINYDSSIVTFTSTSSFAYNYTFKPELLTTNGLDYYIKMYWGNYSLSSPDSDYISHPVSIQVRIDKIANAFSTMGKKYSVVTIPVIFNGTTLLNEMIRNLGPLNNSIWRIFKWRNNTYEEYINDNDWQITPGDGFWMVSKESVTLDLQNCITVPTNTQYKIRLQPGWNQIGSPYLFSVPASAIIIPKDKKVETTLLEWLVNDQNYSVVDNSGIMNEWEGYYIKNNESDSVDIFIIPRRSQNIIAKTNKSTINNEKLVGWKINLEINASGKSNNLAEIGLLPDSKDEWDQNDVSEPPQISTVNISVIFPHEEWADCRGNYLRDYRVINSEGNTWDVEIKNGVNPNSAVEGEIKLNVKGELPKEFTIYIFDTETMNPSTYNGMSYKFKFNEGNTKKLKIVVGTKEYLDRLQQEFKNTPEKIKNYSLLQNYPNPFNPSTTIEFLLPKVSFVTLKVYNLLGQKISTIVDEKLVSGSHKVLFNANNLPNGVYFYRLQTEEFVDSKKLILLK